MTVKTIKEQLELEEKFKAGKAERVFYDLDEPLPFERPEIEKQLAEEEVFVQFIIHSK